MDWCGQEGLEGGRGDGSAAVRHPVRRSNIPVPVLEALNRDKTQRGQQG